MKRREFCALPAAALGAPVNAAKAAPRHSMGFDLVPGPNGGFVVPKEWRDIVADEMKKNHGYESQYCWRMRAYGGC